MLWIWLCTALGLLLLELISGEMTALMLSMGALIAMICAALGLDWPWQVAACGVSALAAVFFLRPLLRDWIQPASIGLSTDGFVGQSGQVIESLSPGQRGKVKIHGEVWNAIAYDAIPAGQTVMITRIQNNCMEVVAESALHSDPFLSLEAKKEGEG